MNVWVYLILVLIAILGLLLAVVIFLMTYLLLHPPRMTDGKAVWLLKRLSPGDLGLSFRPIMFSIRDHQSGRPMRMAAWWIPHSCSEGRCVVLIHGYADAKVGAIAWAPLFHEMGYNILAIDLRAHGESEGKFSTAGYFERQDLNQILDQMLVEFPRDTEHLVLFGMSLGAATALATAALRQDISAIILDSPIIKIAHSVREHCKQLGLPYQLSGAVVRMAKWMAGADFAELDAVKWVHSIPCPILTIHGTMDPFFTTEDLRQWRAVLQHRAKSLNDQYWAIEECGHLLGYSNNPNLYSYKVRQFLSETDHKR
jgi:uncharacterized protein